MNALDTRIFANNDLLATEQHIDAVFGTDDACALGAMSAIEGAGKSATIVVGFGATAEALAAIARGSPLVADAAPDAGAIGRRLVQAVAARLHGRTKGGGPALVLVPARLVERDSLAPPARAH